MGNVAPAAAENSTKLGDLAVHHPPHFHADRRVAFRSFPDIDYSYLRLHQAHAITEMGRHNKLLPRYKTGKGETLT